MTYFVTGNRKVYFALFLAFCLGLKQNILKNKTVRKYQQKISHANLQKEITLKQV